MEHCVGVGSYYFTVMARAARASVGGICYHVMNRGNERPEKGLKKQNAPFDFDPFIFSDPPRWDFGKESSDPIMDWQNCSPATPVLEQSKIHAGHTH